MTLSDGAAALLPLLERNMAANQQGFEAVGGEARAIELVRSAVHHWQ